MEEDNKIEIPAIVVLSVQSDDGYFQAFWQIHGGRTMSEAFHDLEGRRFAVGIEPKYSSYESFISVLHRRIKHRNKTLFNKKG